MPGIDHPFVVDGSEKFAVEMRDVAELETTKRRMRVKSSQPVVVVYTTNWLPAKDKILENHAGGIHLQHAAICLETCNYSDAVNNYKEKNWPPKSACLLYSSQAHFKLHDSFEPEESQENMIETPFDKVDYREVDFYEHATIHSFTAI